MVLIHEPSARIKSFLSDKSVVHFATCESPLRLREAAMQQGSAMSSASNSHQEEVSHSEKALRVLSFFRPTASSIPLSLCLLVSFCARPQGACSPVIAPVRSYPCNQIEFYYTCLPGAGTPLQKHVLFSLTYSVGDANQQWHCHLRAMQQDSLVVQMSDYTTQY